jgi:transposase
MARLADRVEVVLGVDTHKHQHTAAVVSAVGTVLDERAAPATEAGYGQLLRLADAHPGRRAWAIEGTGSYGAGLTRFLQARGEEVLEVDRPRRVRRRMGAKSDPLDAVRAAREALGRAHQAAPTRPRPATPGGAPRWASCWRPGVRPSPRRRPRSA